MTMNDLRFKAVEDGAVCLDCGGAVTYAAHAWIDEWTCGGCGRRHIRSLGD